MKKTILFTFVVMLSLNALSQENSVTLSSGYSFAKIDDTDIKTTGWRVMGTYEFNPAGGMFAHGFSFGSLSLKGTDGVGFQKIKYTVNSFPLYYAPKVLFGNEKFRGFFKGILGTQIASLKREGAESLSSSDFGFYVGAGAGITYFVKENIFINVEYEIAWASNSMFRDSWINTIGGGIGFKF